VTRDFSAICQDLQKPRHRDTDGNSPNRRAVMRNILNIRKLVPISEIKSKMSIAPKHKSSIVLKFVIFLLVSLSLNTINAQDVCKFIKVMQEYQSSIVINYTAHPVTIDTSTFNLVYYLKLFDKLKMDPGRKSEIYYSFSGLDGDPIIYSIPENFNIREQIEKKVDHQMRYKIKSDMDTAIMKQIAFYEIVTDSSLRAFNYIIPDDSEEGYIQYLFFYVMGEQFGLFSHSLDFQKRIICTKEDIKNMIDRYMHNRFFDVDKKQLKSLIEINPFPQIKLDVKNCSITWYELETHNGFYQIKYEIDKKAPFKIREISKKRLLEISQNFNY
jgi:hypothetical protein